MYKCVMIVEHWSVLPWWFVGELCELFHLLEDDLIPGLQRKHGGCSQRGNGSIMFQVQKNHQSNLWPGGWVLPDFVDTCTPTIKICGVKFQLKINTGTFINETCSKKTCMFNFNQQLLAFLCHLIGVKGGLCCFLMMCSVL